MKKAFTLVEIIFTIAIAGILIVGTTQMLSSLATSAQRAKTLSDLSLDTQSAIDQISSLLYYRVPNSVIGYDGSGTVQDITSMTDDDNKILEWIGTLQVASMYEGTVSNFIDMAGSTPPHTLKSPLSNFTTVKTIMSNKFGKNITNTALVFAGSFDSGVGSSVNDFGWHGHTPTNNIYPLSGTSSGEKLVITGTKPTFIYEKYYIADTGYAVARGADINMNATCMKSIKNTGLSDKELNNALILFYDFRPWKGETFCADKGTKGTKRDYGASLIALDIQGLRVDYKNFTIRLSIDAKRDIRGRADANASSFVTVAKQKVVF